MMLPVVAFALASAGAVSTNPEKASDADKAAIQGFIQNGSTTNCLPVTVDCSEVNTNQACMTNELIPRQVWLKEGNACVKDLYRVIH